MDTKPRLEVITSDTPSRAEGTGSLRSIAADSIELLTTATGNANTSDAYRRDLADFLGFFSGHGIDAAAVEEIIGMSKPALIRLLTDYRSDLQGRNLAAATTNRRLATVRQLLRIAHDQGAPCADGRGLVKDVRGGQSRDTRGPGIEAAVRILDAVDRSTTKGKRNYAMLLLFYTNALRRNEILATNVGDFNPRRNILRIKGKGQGGEKVSITLPPDTATAISEYLEARAEDAGDDPVYDAPLFVNYHHRAPGQNRLTGRGLAGIVAAYGKNVLDEDLHAHGFRHMAATEALLLTGGDVSRVRYLTRHVKLDMLLIYRDQVKDEQGELSRMLSDRIKALRNPT